MAVGRQDQKIENPKIKANDVSCGEIYAPCGTDLYVCMCLSMYGCVCGLKNVCCSEGIEGTAEGKNARDRENGF